VDQEDLERTLFFPVPLQNTPPLPSGESGRGEGHYYPSPRLSAISPCHPVPASVPTGPSPGPGSRPLPIKRKGCGALPSCPDKSGLVRNHFLSVSCKAL
jgi:hypothetical protein